MAPSLRVVLLLPCLIFFVSALNAESPLRSLSNNPFSRPEIFNAPPPPAERTAVTIPPEQVVLKLTATMVSENAPMAIVDGKLLAIGEEIEGLRLVAVNEGEAIFSRAGKKVSFTIDDRESR